VFARTVEWAVEHGITTATFHIQTPYPGTGLYARMEKEGRITTRNWDLYDTRHVVYRPTHLSPESLKAGYDWAYREFYRWPAMSRASLYHGSVKHQAKHFFYAAGWKKFEPAWNLVIRAKQLRVMTPLLEAVLSKVTRQSAPRLAASQPKSAAANSLTDANLASGAGLSARMNAADAAAGNVGCLSDGGDGVPLNIAPRSGCIDAAS
jgi:hypothetical protein